MFTLRALSWAVCGFLFLILGCSWSSTSKAEEAICAAKDLGVDLIKKDENSSVCATEPQAERQNTPNKKVKLCLGDQITLTVKGLQAVTAVCKPKLVLFLNGQTLNSVVPMFSDQPNEVKFHLVTGSEPGAVWKDIFQDPLRDGGEREIRLNVGFPNDPSPTPAVAMIRLFPPLWTALFVFIVVGLAIIFGLLATKSNVLRDPPPPTNTVAVANGRLNFAQPPPEAGPFSLARSQGAWWLFFIISAYALIGIVTGNFTSSLNATALTLLGIGAGTVLGGVVISQSKVADQAQRADQLKQRYFDLVELDQLHPLAAGPGAPPSAAAQQRYTELLNKNPDASAQIAAGGLNNAITRTANDYAIATNQWSDGFFMDILSDADGVSFPRFQLFAWTMVLGVVFAINVLREVAMPVFDGTLLGLMGLSSGTYIGMKIPESTVPKQALPPAY